MDNPMLGVCYSDSNMTSYIVHIYSLSYCFDEDL